MRSIIITAITLFALSGAILGFTVGALTHARPAQQPITQHQTTNKPKPTVTQTVTPTVTSTATTVAVQKLCPPSMPYTITPGATANASIYTLSVQANAGASCKAIAASGIATRIWLILGNKPNINTNALLYPSYPAGLSDPANFPNEVPNGLQFIGGTPQVQMTDSTGLATWKVTLSPNLPKGNYFIVGLNDWNGISCNWSWSGEIPVK